MRAAYGLGWEKREEPKRETRTEKKKKKWNRMEEEAAEEWDPGRLRPVRRGKREERAAAATTTLYFYNIERGQRACAHHTRAAKLSLSSPPHCTVRACGASVRLEFLFSVPKIHCRRGVDTRTTAAVERFLSLSLSLTAPVRVERTNF